MAGIFDSGGTWGREQTIGFGVSIALGLAAVVLVGVQEPSVSSALRLIGVGVLVGGAAFATGSLVGFLFGVPRVNAEVGGPRRYGANTNIEQISDWLSKILVGVALVELRAIAGGLGDLFNAIGESLAITEGVAFAGGLVMYFVIVGFFGGWVVTRIYLPRAMSLADRLVEDAFKQKVVEAQEAARNLDFERADQARAEAAKILENARLRP